MTAPRFAPCRCAHSHADHNREGFAPQCTATSCTCLAYRPSVPQAAPVASPVARNVQPVATAALRESSVEDLIADGKDADDKRIVALAEKVAALAADLRTRLATYDEQAAARKRIADLEAQLKAARQSLGGSAVKAARSTTPGDAICPDCGKDGLSNVGVHRSKAHGWRKDGAA